jgi:hypothetical protein
MLAFVSNRKTLKKSWRNKGDRDALLLACGVKVLCGGCFMLAWRLSMHV